MWMLTLNVILGYQGLLFLDFLWMLYFVLLQLTCNWTGPSSFLPSRVSSKRAQGFSSEVDILEIYPSCLLPKAGTVFEINVHVIIFPRNFCLLFNLLSPKVVLRVYTGHGQSGASIHSTWREPEVTGNVTQLGQGWCERKMTSWKRKRKSKKYKQEVDFNLNLYFFGKKNPDLQMGRVLKPWWSAPKRFSIWQAGRRSR